jgi:hypothetical protein
MKFYISIILILVFAFCFACGSSQTTANKPAVPSAEEIERAKTFVLFQSYVGTHYPEWTVRGLRKEASETGDDGTKSIFYHVILTNSKAEKIVYIVCADFVLPDGTTETKLYEPSKTTLKRMEEKKIKAKGVEEDRDENEGRGEDIEPSDPRD